MGSGASFKMDISGFDRMVEHAIKHFSSKNQELMEECGEIIASGIDKSFEKETSPDGKPWEKSKRAKGGEKTLTDTAVLRNSIGYEAIPDAVAIGTNVPYAVYHQQPEEPGKIMPERKFIGISDATEEELKDAVTDFGKAGFES